jgi:hypothetical protein
MRVPAIVRMAAVARIDAAVRAGEQQRAATSVEELATFAGGTERPWARSPPRITAAPCSPTRPMRPALFESALAHH